MWNRILRTLCRSLSQLWSAPSEIEQDRLGRSARSREELLHDVLVSLENRGQAGDDLSRLLHRVVEHLLYE